MIVGFAGPQQMRSLFDTRPLVFLLSPNSSAWRLYVFWQPDRQRFLLKPERQLAERRGLLSPPV